MKKVKLTFKQKSALRYLLNAGPCEPRSVPDRLVMESMVKRGWIKEKNGLFDLREDSRETIQKMVDERNMGLR